MYKRVGRRKFLKQAGATTAGATVLAASAPVANARPNSEGFVLVRSGQPAATIVIAAKPTGNARIAAQELQHYIQKMSGARLAITMDDQAPPGPLIHVGASRLTRAMAGLVVPSGRSKHLREEGFIIEAAPGRLVLAGNDEEPYYGTRYAVYEMLHRLGVRWFLPGTLGEVIPHSETIVVPRLSLRDAPDFPMRNFWEHGRDQMDEEREQWKIRNLMNARSADWFGVPGDGSIAGYLPKDQFKDHPDWFALRLDGTRDSGMVCMTSPGMIAAFVERVKQDARNGKPVSAFAPDDGAPRCYSDGCMKLASAFDGFGSNDRDPWPESSTSQEWFYFVNQVLEGVHQEFPDHIIATNGYSNRELAPELPHFNRSKNLVVMFANISACTIHGYDDPRCWQMRRQGEMIRGWTAVCDKTWIYNYNYTMLVGKGTLTPMVHRIRDTIPLLKEWGIIGFNDQDECDWSYCGLPTRIVRARLEWNTKADANAILDAFFAAWFGTAAKPMRGYYDTLEDAFARSAMHGHEDVILPAIYTDSLIETLGRFIGAAEKLAASDSEKSHVGLERLIYDHLKQYTDLERAKRECRYADAVTCADRMIALKAKMNQITPFMGWHPYPTYDIVWEKNRMQELLTRTAGPVGKLLTRLPEQVKFRTDPFDDGRYERWDRPEMDDSTWGAGRLTGGWESQGMLDSRGRPYKGIAWYRMSVEIPARLDHGVWLMAPAAVNEVWVWVNGQFIGRRPYTVPWNRPQPVEMDLTPAIRFGRRNQITFRVLANYDVFGANGIYERPFLYARSKMDEKQSAATVDHPRVTGRDLSLLTRTHGRTY